MRCLSCGIDVGEKYRICPLCASETVDIPPVLEGIEVAGYPEISALRPFPQRQVIPRNKPFHHYVFVIAVVLSVLAVFPGIWLMWSVHTALSMVIPSICITAEAFILVKSLAIKTMRRNAIIYTIPLMIINAVLAIAAAVQPQMSPLLPVAAIACGVFILAVLRMIEPEQFKVEVQSRFHH